MPQPIRAFFADLRERIRAGAGRRSAAFVLALLFEGLLLLTLLSLGRIGPEGDKRDVPLVSFETRPAAQETTPPPESQPEGARQAEPPVPPPPEPRESPPEPAPTSPPFILLPSDQMVSADIAPKQNPVRPAGPARMMGPPAPATPADTPRVGTAPNGEPLYAASWYREPYEDELTGYLSTATGPGWGLIACRTVPDFLVEDCVGLDEYPRGSNITRAVLAAAWQFRVRPPRVGGRVLVGEWVRIRIDYELRRR